MSWIDELNEEQRAELDSRLKRAREKSEREKVERLEREKQACIDTIGEYISKSYHQESHFGVAELKKIFIEDGRDYWEYIDEQTIIAGIKAVGGTYQRKVLIEGDSPDTNFYTYKFSRKRKDGDPEIGSSWV